MKTVKMLCVFACALLALTLAGGQASAANLLGNADFETGSLAPWAGVGGVSPISTITVIATDNGPTLPGSHCAYLNNQAQAIGLTMAQTTALGTGAAGTVFYSYDLGPGSSGNGGVFFVEIFAQNSVGAVIGNAGLKGPYFPTAWTHYSGSFTAPANTDHFTIQFEAVTGAVVGSYSTMKVDNVDLHQDLATPASSSTWGRIKNLYR